MKLTKKATLTCRTCATTITAPTKREAVTLAKAGLWRDVEKSPQCHTCHFEELREAGKRWQPGDPVPF